MQFEKHSLKEFIPRIRKNLKEIEGRRIIIVGDVGLDEYVWGEVRRISPEAPVPVLEVTHEEGRIGMAANVAQNVSSLGGKPILVGVVGADVAADSLKKLLTDASVPTDGLLLDSARPTTRKTRAMSHQHHLLRIDYEHRKFISASVEEKLFEKVQSVLDGAHGLVIEDYHKGVLSENLMQKIITACRSKKIPVICDPHRSTPLKYYRGVNLLKPNRDESFVLAGKVFDETKDPAETLNAVGIELREKIQAEAVVITKGRAGMSLFQDSTITHLPTASREVADVTGAGDTVSAALALAWAGGFNLAEACALANFAAGVVVGKVGSASCTQQELIQAMDQNEASE